MLGRVASVVERRPVLVLLCAILVSGFMAYGVTKLSVTTDFKVFLPENYPSVKTTMELENKFGPVSSEVILLKADNVTSATVIRNILELENILRSDPRLENYAVMYSSYVDLVLPYVPNYQLLPDQMLEASVKALLDNFSANPQAAGTINNLLTENRGAAKIVIYPNSQLTRSELIEKTDVLRGLVDNFGATHTNLELGVGGTYSNYSDITSVMNRDNGVLIPAAMVLVVVILFLTFRRGSDILLCFAVIGLGSMWAIGVMGYLGLTFTMIHVALVPLLLGMGVDYSIYMLNRYYEERGKGLFAKDSIGISIRTIGVAILLCMITTVIGFGSFSISDIPPLQVLGVLAAFGIFFDFVLAITLLPAIVVLRDGRKVGKVKATIVRRGKRVDRALSIAATGAERHRRIVVIVVVAIVALSAVAAIGVETTMSFETFLPADIESLKTQTEIENLFGGQSYLFTLAKGNMFSPSSLLTMYLFENAVLSNENNPNHQYITGSMSLTDLILAHTIGRNVLTITEAEIAAIVENLRLTPSTQTQVNMLLTTDNREAVIIFYTSAKTDKEMRQATDIIKSSVPAFTSGTLDLTTNGAPAVGGEPAIIADILGGILSGMINTTLVALVLCFIVLTLIFRSPLMGVLTVLPVTLVVVWELGTLRLLGWSLDVLTMSISALAIGSGIDYSIQMVYRFREEWKTRGKPPEEAVKSAVMNTGMSLLAAMGTTMGVFVVLTLSKMPVLAKFGGLTAVVVFYALIAALFVLPSFMVIYALHKKGKK